MVLLVALAERFVVLKEKFSESKTKTDKNAKTKTAQPDPKAPGKPIAYSL